MKILIIGLPYFARLTAKRLSAFDKSNHYASARLDGRLLGKVLFIVKILFADIVYQIGGSTRYGKALRLATVLHKQIIMHWVGTDVLEALEAQRNGDLDWQLLKSSKHLCDATWLKSELSRIAIPAKHVYLSCVDSNIPEPTSLPESFSILTYIGNGRPEFYGIERIIALAEKFPEIPIKISTLSGYCKLLPKNIQLLGYVKDLSEEIKKSCLYIRVPEHDGLSFSVNEALSLGRHVGYIYEYPGTILMRNNAEMFSAVQSLNDAHAAGVLKVNYIGYEYVKEHFSSETILRELAMELRK